MRKGEKETNANAICWNIIKVNTAPRWRNAWVSCYWEWPSWFSSSIFVRAKATVHKCIRCLQSSDKATSRNISVDNKNTNHHRNGDSQAFNSCSLADMSTTSKCDPISLFDSLLSSNRWEMSAQSRPSWLQNIQTMSDNLHLMSKLINLYLDVLISKYRQDFFEIFRREPFRTR